MTITPSNGGLIRRVRYPARMERLHGLCLFGIGRSSSAAGRLRIVRYQPIMPLRYWLSGGLRRWNLLPGFLDYVSRALERGLLLLAPDFGGFAVIELLRARLPRDA
jgi:hypothetical protein